MFPPLVICRGERGGGCLPEVGDGGGQGDQLVLPVAGPVGDLVLHDAHVPGPVRVQVLPGPGGTDMMSILVLLQSPQVQTLGITVVTGDQWRDEEVAHTLRLLELVGRADIPVAPGAVYPLVRTQAETKLWEQQY